MRLIREALTDADIRHRLTVAPNGMEALNLLHRVGSDSTKPQFELIFLDLNLPKKNGREVLADLKTDPRLKHAPVIVLTTSKAEQDVRESYALHANCYVTKPLDFEHFIHTVRWIEHFWLSVVTLPGGAANDS